MIDSSYPKCPACASPMYPIPEGLVCSNNECENDMVYPKHKPWYLQGKITHVSGKPVKEDVALPTVEGLITEECLITICKAFFGKRWSFLEVESMRAALETAAPLIISAYEARKWQPIGFAPKGPEEFIMILDENPILGGIAWVSWQNERWYGVDQYGLTYDSKARRAYPKFFQPLPPPPEASHE